MIVVAAPSRPPADEPLTESVTVRMTSREKAALVAASRADGMTMSAWMRRLLQAAT